MTRDSLIILEMENMDSNERSRSPKRLQPPIPKAHHTVDGWQPPSAPPSIPGGKPSSEQKGGNHWNWGKFGLTKFPKTKGTTGNIPLRPYMDPGTHHGTTTSYLRRPPQPQEAGSRTDDREMMIDGGTSISGEHLPPPTFAKPKLPTRKADEQDTPPSKFGKCGKPPIPFITTSTTTYQHDLSSTGHTNDTLYQHKENNGKPGEGKAQHHTLFTDKTSTRLNNDPNSGQNICETPPHSQKSDTLQEQLAQIKDAIKSIQERNSLRPKESTTTEPNNTSLPSAGVVGQLSQIKQALQALEGETVSGALNNSMVSTNPSHHQTRGQQDTSTLGNGNTGLTPDSGDQALTTGDQKNGRTTMSRNILIQRWQRGTGGRHCNTQNWAGPHNT